MNTISIDLVLTQVQDESRPVSTVTRLAIRGLLGELKTLRQNGSLREDNPTMKHVSGRFVLDINARALVLAIEMAALNNHVFAELSPKWQRRYIKESERAFLELREYSAAPSDPAIP